MKTRLLACSIAALTVSTAMAVQVKTGGSWGPYQTGSGGEFTLTSMGLDVSAYSPLASGYSNGAGTPSFQTFCLENSTPPEYIYQNTTYDVVVSTKAVLGGPGGDGDGDSVSAGTGWLYSQFATGTLAGYNYGNGRTTTAGQLQNAFWWLEDEGGVVYSDSNPFMAAVVAEFGTQAAAKAGSAADYGVFALNMTRNGGILAQDQLYYRGVPESGATLILLGIGVCGLAFVSRRARS